MTVLLKKTGILIKAAVIVRICKYICNAKMIGNMAVISTAYSRVSVYSLCVIDIYTHSYILYIITNYSSLTLTNKSIVTEDGTVWERLEPM